MRASPVPSVVRERGRTSREVNFFALRKLRRRFVSVGFSSLHAGWFAGPGGVQPASARQFVTLSSAQVLKSVPGIAHFMKSNTPGGWVLGPFYLFTLFNCVPYRAALFLHSEDGARRSPMVYSLTVHAALSVHRLPHLFPLKDDSPENVVGEEHGRL